MIRQPGALIGRHARANATRFVGEPVNRAIGIKTLLIAALALALLVPVSMIRDLIAERQARRNEAVEGIALGWGKRQVLAGPYLLIPYERSWTETTRETIDGALKERRSERTESLRLRLAVERVHWSIAAATHEKTRGIYKARLYTARIEAEGSITLPAHSHDASYRYRWGTPQLVLGISDPRGIRKVSPLSLDGATFAFAPGAGDAALAAGIHADLGFGPAAEARTLAFGFSLELAGSEAFSIVPLGRDTSVAMRADWPHPSFQGLFLPAKSERLDNGFSAEWQVSRYAAQGAERLAACRKDPCPGLAAQELGVSFIEPVGLYQQLERASKYGFLFIGLLFAACFLFELLRRLMIHPIQYALIGLALAIFFLLLTALSEHLRFGLAYALATLACVGIVTAYAVRVLQSAAIGLAFGSALAALYAVLYFLLQAEDHALLGGAVLLFVLLAGTMLATRNVDWYRLTRREGVRE